MMSLLSWKCLRLAGGDFVTTVSWETHMPWNCGMCRDAHGWERVAHETGLVVLVSLFPEHRQRERWPEEGCASSLGWPVAETGQLSLDLRLHPCSPDSAWESSPCRINLKNK